MLTVAISRSICVINPCNIFLQIMFDATHFQIRVKNNKYFTSSQKLVKNCFENYQPVSPSS